LIIDREHSTKKSGLNGMATLICVVNIQFHGICYLRSCCCGGGRGFMSGGIHVISHARQA
jgi:hypothetical protein